jgi:uncharacterized 2Fe-2S/4Fe-4S cluster protein (DUF4445 family)
MARKAGKHPRGRKSSIVSTRRLKEKRGDAWLNVLPVDLWQRVRRGETIWEALQDTDLDPGGDCGGLGKCGKCKVKVITALGRPTKSERSHLTPQERREGIRLACRTRIRKDLLIHLGVEDQDEEYVQILKTGALPVLAFDPPVVKRPVRLHPGPEQEPIAGLDRIKMALGPEYSGLSAMLHSLRTLPQGLGRSASEGTAVLHGTEMLAWQDNERGQSSFGMAFDLGTSTLVGKLVNLLDASEIAAVSLLNSQVRYGADVISRLHHIREHADGLEDLHSCLVRDLNRIIRRLLEVGDITTEEVFLAVAAGNTTIQHILLSLPPSGIAEAPFSPLLTDGIVVKAEETGLRLHPEARLYVMPTRSGYIGGDLLGLILCSGAADNETDLLMGMDFGTNGEIFLGDERRILACSAAAGPALEGANISRGMIARMGAVEAVRFDGDVLERQVIGNIQPKGLCGSGLVDLVAVLLHWNVIDPQGLVRKPARDMPETLRQRIIRKNGAYHFTVATEEEGYNGSPILLTQKDVRQLQLAKAAIAAGTQILLEDLGAGVSELDRIFLAGALGNYVNPLSAMRIGLLPMVDPDLITSLGNAASTGAIMVLLSRENWQRVGEVKERLEHVELSSRADFNERFVEAMDFPDRNFW